MTTPTASDPVESQRLVLWWLLLAGMIVIEFLVFRAYYVRELLPLYPRLYDQATYLAQSYDTFELIRQQGPFRGLLQSFLASSVQGTLLQHEAALAYFFASPGRLTAITVNFAHLAVLQVVIAALGFWARRPLAALAVCGVTLTASSIYQAAGGLEDFRLDFAGLCLLAIIGLVVVRSAGFRHRSWSLIAAVVAIIAVMTRTILIAYLAPALTGVALALIIFRRYDPLWLQRLTNVLLSAMVTAFVLSGYIVMKWDQVMSYYIVGHQLANLSEIRAREVGVASSVDHLTFYLRSALRDHAGWLFSTASVLLLGVFVREVRRRRRERVDTPTGVLSVTDGIWSAVFAVGIMITAYTVLTADVSKSPVVGNVFVAAAIPLLWLLGCSHARVSARERSPSSAVYVLLLVVGLATFVAMHMRPASLRVTRNEMSQYTSLIDRFSSTSSRFGQVQPVISFDELSEYFNPEVFRALAFERSGTLLSPRWGLGGTLEAVSREDASALLAMSDYAILGRDRELGAGDKFYPVSQSIRELMPDLYSWAEGNMMPIMETSFFGRRVTLFMKPAAICTGNDGGWVNSRGVECRVPAAALESHPIIELAGPLSPYLSGPLGASIRESKDPGSSAQSPCHFVAPQDGKTSGQYAVRCIAPSGQADSDGNVSVHIQFDQFFVPKSIGLNEDVRELVVPWPTSTNLLPKSNNRP